MGKIDLRKTPLNGGLVWTGLRFALLILVIAVSTHAQKYLQPSDYFPTTPGSQWKFKRISGSIAGDSSVESTAIITTDDQYSLVPLNDIGSSCPQEYYYVPRLRGEFECEAFCPDGYIFGSQMRVAGLAGCGLLIDIIRTEPHAIWSIPEGTGGRCLGNLYACGSREVISVDTSVMVSGVLLDSLLHIRQSNSDSTRIEDDYYRKNTGLVYQVVVHTATNSKSEIQLTEFIPGSDVRLDQVVFPDSLSGVQTSRMPVDYWGNSWTFIPGSFPPNPKTNMGNSMDINKLKAGPETLRVVSHASSHLPVVLTTDDSGVPTLDGDKMILENRWRSFNVVLNQPGNDSYRPAPTFQGAACVFPFFTATYDSVRNILAPTGYPDSDIVWTLDDSVYVGKGSSFTPVKPGKYRASISHTFTDSLCGGPYTFDSDELIVNNTQLTRLARAGLPITFARILGSTVAFRMNPEEFMAARVRIFNYQGKAETGIRAELRNGSPEISTQYRMVPGIYFYEVISGPRKESGRVLVGIP